MRALAVLVLLAACHPQPVPTPRAHDMQTAPPPSTQFCAPPVTATTSGVCAQMFTSTGMACVRCANAHGCIDAQDVIYCVEGACTEDRACKLQLPDEMRARPRDGGT